MTVTAAFTAWPGTELFAGPHDELAWQDQALCAEVDPDLWFPEQGGSTRQAKAICRRCEVREDCLAWALEHSGPEDAGSWGIWGGLSVPEREALLTEHGLARPAAERNDRCRKGHFRTPQNTRADADAVRCMDCERARYLATTSRESAA